MKFTHKLCAATLLAAVGFAVVVPNSTKADNGVGVEGGAEIEFTSTASKGEETNPPGGSGSEVLPTDQSDNRTSDAHGFGISYVTGLKFGQHENITNTGNETYWAQKWVAKNEAGQTMENANFVNFEDIRQKATHEYVIQAKLTSEFKTTVDGAEKKLNGVSLTHNNPRLAVRGLTDATLAPSAGLKAGAVVTKEGQTMMLDNSAPAGEEIGYGYYTLYFGAYDKLGQADGADQSIKMTLPKAENKVVYNTKYTGGITWTMSETPQP